jgi:hypothetical protein
MSSDKQIEANRTNAKKSTGPRTAIGTAVSSRNARKHALTTIGPHNPIYAPQIEAFAKAICPDTSNPRLWPEALTIGECTIVLRCVGAQRLALIERLLEGSGLPATCLCGPSLDRLERYERRALSRRKRAVETFITILNNIPVIRHSGGYRGPGF